VVDWPVVWARSGYTCHVPACSRVHCQDCRAVALEWRLLAWAFLALLPVTADHYSVCRQAARDWTFLAASLEADPRTLVLDWTKEATKGYRRQVHTRVLGGAHNIHCSHCITRYLPQQPEDELWDLQVDLRGLSWIPFSS